MFSLSCCWKVAIHKIILFVLFLSNLPAAPVMFHAPRSHCWCVIGVDLSVLEYFCSLFSLFCFSLARVFISPAIEPDCSQRQHLTSVSKFVFAEAAAHMVVAFPGLSEFSQAERQQYSRGHFPTDWTVTQPWDFCCCWSWKMAPMIVLECVLVGVLEYKKHLLRVNQL